MAVHVHICMAEDNFVDLCKLLVWDYRQTLLPTCIWKPSLLRRSVKTRQSLEWLGSHSLLCFCILGHSASPPASSILSIELMFLRYNVLFASKKIKSRWIFPWIQWNIILQSQWGGKSLTVTQLKVIPKVTQYLRNLILYILITNKHETQKAKNGHLYC